MNVCILIATRNREAQLKQLLAHLKITIANSRLPVEVNILNTGKEDYVGIRQYLFDGVKYNHKPTIGYATARNSLINGIDSFPDVIVFIDDDEFPTEKWLDELISPLRNPLIMSSTGPILPDFGAYSGWKTQIRDYYHNVPGRETVANDSVFFSSGNLAINYGSFKEKLPKPLFDTNFDLIGGEDTKLKVELLNIFKINQFAYSPNAIVYEQVPAERLSFLWMVKKSIRTGRIIAKLRSRQSIRRRFLLLVVSFFRIFPRCFSNIKENPSFGLRRTILFLLIEGIKVLSIFYFGIVRHE